MEPRHKQLIRSNYIVLADQLSTAIDDVCADLYQSNIISKHMKDAILEGNRTRKDKARALLDLIVNRGRNAFDALYTISMIWELYVVSDTLNPIKAPHQDLTEIAAPTQSDAQVEPLHDLVPVHNTLQTPADIGQVQQAGPLAATAQNQGGNERSDQSCLEGTFPRQWPSKEHMKKENIRVKNVAEGSMMYKEYLKSLKPIGQEFCYTMLHEKRGRALIFNNNKFTRPNAGNTGGTVVHLSDRIGSLRDLEALEILLPQLGFEVQTFLDLTAENMQLALNAESDRDHSNFDCIMLFFMSHGNKGIIYGSDGYSIRRGEEVEFKNFLKVKDIKTQICKIRSLAGKPKLFFIQACRGSHEDGGIETSPVTGATAAKLEEVVRKLDINLQDVQDTLAQLDGDEDEAVGGEQHDGASKIPSDSDYFVAMSTVSGNVSWRNKFYGTWFIQAIVYVFWNYAHENDLNKFMTLVNKLVSSNVRTQVCETRQTLRKTFFFFPGLTFPPPR